MPWFSDRAGSSTACDHAAGGIAFRTTNNVGTPDVDAFRGSIAWPIRTPANASLRPRGTPTHSSGPPWLATPSM